MDRKIENVAKADEKQRAKRSEAAEHCRRKEEATDARSRLRTHTSKRHVALQRDLGEAPIRENGRKEEETRRS